MSHARAMIIGLVLLTAAGGAMADPEPASPQDLFPVYRSYQGGTSDAPPVYGQTPEGYLRFILAPGDSRFDNSAARNKNVSTPEAAAQAFIEANKSAFGVKSNRAGFDIKSIDPLDDGAIVKMEQTYDGITVFGSSVNVQLDKDGNVVSVLSDPMRDASLFDQGRIGTTPTRSSADATSDAINAVAEEYGASNPYSASEPKVVIYDPDVVGEAGEPRLAYQTRVHGDDDYSVDHDVFVDAHTGSVLLSYSLHCTAQSRYIYDLNNSENWETLLPGTFARAEGGSPSSVDDVNIAYDLLGDTYDYYLNQHGRDSIDGLGLPMRATVRIPVLNAFYITRFENADFDLQLASISDLMVFGQGFLTDDIAGHELTHGVTDYESRLIYLNESGAINESFSDIWGEFIDLSNGSGDDSDEVRWLMGEESIVGAIRNMADPPEFDQPDRYSDFQRVGFDNGGVHINSGIGNKLCYLLTDGTGLTPFNEKEVTAMGMSRVADIFYRAQTEFLGPASDYTDLFFALSAAANMEGWSYGDLENLQRAAEAVEIWAVPPFGKPLRHLRAQSELASSSVTVSWKEADYPASRITVVRNTSRFPESPTDGDVRAVNPANEWLVDTGLSIGQQYFYGVFAEYPLFVGEEIFAQVTAGEGLPQYLAEEFVGGNDLSFTQIMYSPVGDVVPAFESGNAKSYVTFHNYNATIQTGITQLPVSPIDPVVLNLPNDEVQFIGTAYIDRPLYFFGRFLESILISANGYIAPTDVSTLHFLNIDGSLNFPSLFSHWDIPRISFLFNDLVPAAGGSVWVQNMDDRLVVTFDTVREFSGSFPPPDNTVQVEFFYSGHIRMTYLSVESAEFVAGLSDGRGVPIEPSQISNPLADGQQTNLDGVGETSVLSLDPIPAVLAVEGDLVSFRVTATTSQVGAVTLSASNLPTGSTFDPVTGVFLWQTDSADGGSYSPLFTATQGSVISTQATLIIISDLANAPIASDLILGPLPETEDDTPLTLQYTYTSPEGLAESGTEIFWYRNGFLVSALYNRLVVPPLATEVGDIWSVAVEPEDSLGLEGTPIFSDGEIRIVANTKADINGDGTVNSIDIQLVVNAVLGKGLGALNPDANIDGDVNSIDIQTVINRVLN